MTFRLPAALCLTLAIAAPGHAGELCLMSKTGQERVCRTAAPDALSVTPAPQERLFTFTRDEGAEMIFGAVAAGSASIHTGTPVRFTVRFAPEGDRAGTGTLTLLASAAGRKWLVPIDRQGAGKLRAVIAPRGSYELGLKLEHYRRSWHALQGDAGQPVAVGTIALPASPSIRGNVVSGGLPVAGALVALEPDGGSVTTDVQGRFIAEALDSWPKRIKVTRKGLGTKAVDLPETEADLTLPPVVMARGVSLQVKVGRGGVSGPLDVDVARDVEENWKSWLATRRMVAGANTVSFDDLEPGTYVVLARGKRPLQRAIAKAVVSAGATNGIEVHLQPATLQGHFAMANSPLGKARVNVICADQAWTSDVDLDASGRFREPLWQRPDCNFAIRGGGMRSRWISSVSLGHLIGLNWEVEVPPHSVTGRLTDPGGMPVRDALVWIRMQLEDHSRMIQSRTDDNGEFAFDGLESGPVTLRAIADGYLVPGPVTFTLEESERTRDVQLRVGPGFLRTVEVVDSHGAPAEGAEVICATGSSVRGSAITDAHGRTTVGTPGEASTLYVLPREGSLTIRRLEGGANASGETVRILVPPPASSLQIAAISTDGVPLPGLTLLMRYNGDLVPPEVARHLRSRQGISLQTDDQGQARLDHIPPGVYEFWPYHTDAEAEAFVASASVGSAPILVNVRTGENKTTVRFRRR
jgi:hypothetical protein